MDVILNDHRQLSSDLLVECVKEKIRADVNGRIGPNDIVEYTHQEYKVNISYFKAWKEKYRALELIMGSAEVSYNLIPCYFSVLQSINAGM